MNRLRLRVLLIEDDEDDYVLTRDLLLGIPFAEYKMNWASSYDAGLEAIGRGEYDVCILDYRLGEHDGLALLHHMMEMKCKIPVIFLTGRGDHEVDVEAMRAGAADYLVKGQISADLLERSIRYSLERRRSQDEREKLIFELEGALKSIKVLRGLLPICPCCKRIRDSDGGWKQLEIYLAEHSEAGFSHTLCPDCEEALRPLFKFAEELEETEIP